MKSYLWIFLLATLVTGVKSEGKPPSEIKLSDLELGIQGTTSAITNVLQRAARR